MTHDKPPENQKKVGRGALSNPTGRFESIEVLSTLDDWQEETPSPIATQYFKDHTKRILSFNDSPDVGFNVSINPYRGCEHGCIYCYARPTHEYLGLSAGLDFERQIFVKTEAPALLRKQLASPSWKPQVIAMSGVTDCYQPIERKLKLTRQCLEVLLEFRNPVGLVTKNALITRDLDILRELAQYQAVCVFVSLTTLDESLQRVLEPRTASPSRRLKAIHELSQAGIPVGVLMAPVIPGLTDHEIPTVLEKAAEAGAQTAGYSIVRLPHGLKTLFSDWLEAHYPTKKGKVLNHLQEIRGGQLNDTRFGQRMHGQGHYAETIAQLFAVSRKRYHLNNPLPPLSTAFFSLPGAKQLHLFPTVQPPPA